MLRLTLYKNCRLNNTYQNVMSVDNITINNVTKSVLEFYLDTLDKITLDIDGVYQEFSGQLIFDYDLLTSGFQSYIYEFNYMKVETYDNNILKIKRYCFIDEIKLVNELVNLNYSEDYWSSYFGYTKGVNKSFLSRLRIDKYQVTPTRFKHIVPRILPINYDGNNPVLYSSLTNFTQNRSAKILVEVQMYDTAEYGSSTNRIVEYFLLSNNLQESGINVPFTGTNYLMSIEGTILRILSYLQFAKVKFTIDGTQQELNYEVGDIYIVPSTFDIPHDTTRTIIGNNSDLLGLYKINDIRDELIYGYIAPNNFKRLSIGTLNTQITTINNGTNSEFIVSLTKDRSNISIKLNCLNQIVDITNDFKYNTPIASITSEQLAQYEIARTLKNTEINNQYKLEGGRVGKAVAQGVQEAGNAAAKIFGALATGGISLIASGIKSATTGYKVGATIGIAQQETEINRNTLTAQFNENNAPIYSATKGIFGNNTNMINAYEGICEFVVDEDNNDFVIQSINNLGFVCYQYVEDTDDGNIFYLRNPSYYINHNINYNVYGFTSISLYGSYTNNIAKVLNEILLQGVKVWFNPSMEEDYYYV